MNRKLIGIAASSAMGLLLIASAVFAKNNGMSLSINSQGSVKLEGIVSAVLPNTISVSSWLGTWTVNTSSAKFLPENALTLADVKVGDRVVVRGAMASGMTVNASTISDLSVRNFNKATGTISNLNASAGTFTLNTGEASISVATNASTAIILNGTASTMSSLSNGMKVAVSGSFNSNTNTFTATHIKAPIPPSAKTKGNGIIKAMLKFFQK